MVAGTTEKKRKMPLGDERTTSSSSSSHSTTNINNFHPKHLLERNIINNLSMKPVNSLISLEGITNKQFNIPTFPILGAIVSLLQNPLLTSMKSTLYNDPLYQNPIDATLNKDGTYDDIHTGIWFLDTFKKKKINDALVVHSSNPPMNYEIKKILVPIIFFIDGVGIGAYGNKSLEPVSFTLGLFKRHIRNQALAWRVMGYIPNTEKSFGIKYTSSGEYGPSLKKKHYQQILSHILKDFISLQKRGGILWKLPFLKQENTVEYQEVQLVFEAIFSVGDTLGNDKLNCRKLTYVPTKTMDTGCCRDCDVTFKYSDQYNFKCNFIPRGYIKQLNSEELDRMSFYDVGLNAFDEVSFGGCEFGINGSTPPEPLHVWYLGIVDFIIDYFLNRITTKTKEYLDRMISFYSRNYSRQSDRFMPNINLFGSGIDKSKLTGHEKGDQLFMIYMVMCSETFKREIVDIDSKSQKRYNVVTTTDTNGNKKRVKVFKHKVIDTTSKYNKWMKVFESMLTFGEWMKSSNSSIKKEDLDENVPMDLWYMDNHLLDDYLKSRNSSLLNDPLTEIGYASGSIPAETDTINNNTNGIESRTITTNSTKNGIDSPRRKSRRSRSNNSNHNKSINDDHVEELDTNHLNQRQLSLLSTIPQDINEVDLDEYKDIDDALVDEVVEEIDCDGEVDQESEDSELCNNRFLRKKTFLISKVEYSIRMFMKDVKYLLNEQDRKKLKTVKFHHLLHFPWYIKKYATPSNFDGSRPEAIGKETAKDPGRHTQHRPATMNIQAATRYFENTTIDLAYCIACSTNQFNVSNGLWNEEYFNNSYLNRLNDGCEDNDIYNFGNNTLSSDNEDHSDDENSSSVIIENVRSASSYTYVEFVVLQNNRNINSRRNTMVLSDISVSKSRPYVMNPNGRDFSKLKFFQFTNSNERD